MDRHKGTARSPLIFELLNLVYAMKRRAERTAQFNAVRATIKEAAESTVQTAILHDEMFKTSLEALAEAHEAQTELPH